MKVRGPRSTASAHASTARSRGTTPNGSSGCIDISVHLAGDFRRVGCRHSVSTPMRRGGHYSRPALSLSWSMPLRPGARWIRQTCFSGLLPAAARPLRYGLAARQRLIHVNAANPSEVTKMRPDLERGDRCARWSAENDECEQFGAAWQSSLGVVSSLRRCDVELSLLFPRWRQSN
jgi:hypothetical protein